LIHGPRVPLGWDPWAGGDWLALAMIDRVDADHGETGLVGVATCQPNEPLTVLAVATTVAEEEKAARSARLVHPGRDTVDLNAGLSHRAGTLLRGGKETPNDRLPNGTRFADLVVEEPSRHGSGIASSGQADGG